MAGIEGDDDLFEYLELKRKEARWKELRCKPLACTLAPQVAAMTQAAEIAREQAKPLTLLMVRIGSALIMLTWRSYNSCSRRCTCFASSARFRRLTPGTGVAP